MIGPALCFDQLGLELGGTAILEQVTFRIEPGALHCILGPNGGGKTSLIRSLLGQMPHTGAIRQEGQVTRTIGYVPQAVELDRNVPMTVLDVMCLISQRKPAFFGGARAYRKSIEAVLERMGVIDKAHSPFGALSGGERQRVLFAQALTPPPQLLVLDEPTAGIDESGAKIVEEAVLELNARGVTVVWINHDWDQVRRIAHRVTGINRRVIFDGLPDAVLTWSAMRAD